LKPDIAALIDGRLSATNRRWRLRDASAYRHVDTVDGPTRIQGIIAHTRGCEAADFPALMDPTIGKHMPDPFVLRDMDVAARRIADVVRRGESLTIFGDYDVDGATSTAIVQRYLAMAGHRDVCTIIPDRENGYGFGEAGLEEAISGLPDVVLLLDCGTHNHDSIARLKAMGSDVVVIDHHKPGATLPAADALVNPHREDQEGEGLSLRNLCTAGLGFLLCVAVNRELRRSGRWQERPEPSLPTLLDLVALGTVCDVMSLTGLNRAFVTAGLKRLDRRANPGLDALARQARVKEGASVTSFGFHIGPRINAGGRIGKARLGADLLSSDDPEFCETVAVRLDELNRERQALEKHAQAEAATMIDPDDEIIVVAGRGWHEGIIGIVAGRLKELWNRPVIAMAIREDGVGKGSGRSIPGVDIGRAVMDAHIAGILDAGGGHAMACGLTTSEDRIPALKEFLNDRIAAASAQARANDATRADAPVWTSDLTMGFHHEVERMGPYGQGWPKPRFILGPARASGLRTTSGGHAFLDLVDDNGSVAAKAWRAEEQGLLGPLEGDAPILALGHVEIDSWNGRAKINYIIEDIITLESSAAQRGPLDYASLVSAG
jgi:single-stranded-DNA-specific exonuclease